jgi:hypothetical protein
VRNRTADEFLSTTLKWVLERVAAIRDATEELARGGTAELEAQLACADAISAGVLGDVVAAQPSPRDAELLMREGPPWTSVSRVALELLRADRDLEWLAREVLLPDPELRGVLFHLAVVGVVLSACRAVGCAIESTSPLYGRRDRPSYRITDLHGSDWELWFEAEGVWSWISKPSPYSEVSRRFSGRASALSADVLLRHPSGDSYVLECKYSEDAGYVRTGLLEALAYGNELQPALGSRVNVRVVSPFRGGALDRPETIASGNMNALDPEELRREITELFTP